jgi:hypothetical protein
MASITDAQKTMLSGMCISASTCDLGAIIQELQDGDGTQTLTNKTIDGDLNTISDIGTASLKTRTGDDTSVVTGTAGTDGYVAKWNGDGDLVDGSAIPTGAIVGDSDTQTLTGKTLTSPIIDDTDAGITVTSADQTHATPVATIPDIVGAADSFVMEDTAQTLTNKTLRTPVIYDGDTGLTVTSADQTHAAPTATIPDIVGAADEFVMEDVSQVLTNKTIDGDDNTLSDIATASLKSVTGSDTAVVTGTAGADGYVAIWDGNGDAITGTVTDTQVATAVTKSTYGMRMYYLGTPEVDDDDQVVTVENMLVGTYTITASPDVPRVLTLTHVAVGAVDTLGTVTIAGTDVNDEVISEVLTPSNGATVTGLKAFKTVTSVTGAGWVINEGNDTIIIGTGPALGLPETVVVSTTNAFAKLALVDEALSAVGTGADAANSTATLTNALNGTSVYIVTNA